MSSTPIYDELAALLLADNPAPAEPAKQAPPPPAPTRSAQSQPVATQPVVDPSKQVRTGGRRRKPEPNA